MENDVRKLNFHLPLCGRGAELAKLNSAYRVATDEGSSRPVVARIHGTSGTGKSRLVEAFRQQVGNSCVFGVGKFDEQENVSEPFSGVVQALNEIVDQLQDLDKIRQEAGPTARVLATIVPKLQEVNDDEKGIVARREATNFDRLKLAARDFLRLVCKNQPVVIFLDDLQWARSDSLEFVQTLITDASAQRFLFIGSHREISNDHPLHVLFDAQQITEITLLSLTLESVVELLASLLKKESQQVQSLGSVVHRKTRGNAIFVIQYLRFLEQEKYLRYSLSTFGWEWDVEKIQSQTNVSVNVVDMIVEKIQTTSSSSRLVLTIGACSGLTRFDVDTLYSVIQAATVDRVHANGRTVESTQELSSILEEAAEDGLLEELSPGKYKFAHDRVLESVLSLLPSGREKTMLHYNIGHQMQEMSTTASNNDFVNKSRLLLLGVRQLNLGSEHVADPREKEMLARLNLEAAEVAIRKSAFFPAAEFLEAGIEQLNQGNAWTQNYELALKLYTSLAEMKLCCGELEASRPLAEAVLKKARRMKDKVGAYRVSITRLIQQDRIRDAIDLSLSVMDQFGVHLPRRSGTFHVVLNVIRTKRMLKGKSDDELLTLPTLTDEAILSALPFHSDLGGMAWLVGDDDFLAILILSGMQIVMTHGQSESSCVSFAVYSLILGMTGDIQEAFRFSKLALHIADEEDLHMHKPHAMALAHFMSHHWLRPYQESLDPIFRSYEMTLEIGDVHHLVYRIVPYSVVYLCCGLRLAPLESDMEKFVAVLTDYSLKTHVALIQPLRQLVLNLMGRSDDPLIFSGEAMDQEPCIMEWTETKNERAL